MTTGGFKWVFPYVEDPTIGAKELADRAGRMPLRPVVDISLVGPKGDTRVAALVDSGSEHTLVAPWISRATGVVPDHNAPELRIGIGGSTRLIRLVDIDLVLHPPPDISTPPITWRAEVGVIDRWEPAWSALLGQVGFFDRFTVTMSRHVQALAVEDAPVFDGRFGIGVGIVDEPRRGLRY